METMSPEQVAKLAIEWHEKNGNSIDSTVGHYATLFAYSRATEQEALRLAYSMHVMRRPMTHCCGVH